MSETPTDDQISSAVHDILRTNDLQQITLRMVMNMLCERFSLPKEHLTPQKAYVRSIINNFLETSYSPPDDEAPSSNKRPAPTEEPEADENNDTEQNDIPGGEEPAEQDVNPTVTQAKPARPAKTARARKPSRTNASAAGGPAKPVKLTGLERPVVLAQPLADFFGEVVIPRSQIPGRISAYAKEHRLQDPSDGRRINCDAALKEALNVDTFTFFSLAKIIAGLVYKPEECEQELQDLAKICEQKTIAEKIKRIAENGGTTKSKPGRPPKKQKVGAAAAASDKPRKPSGLLKPMQLSEALVAVVGESQLPRSEVLKKIWVYIHANGLKDPNNGSRILCDEKLMAVFDGSETVTNMGINKYLSAHMSKIEEG